MSPLTGKYLITKPVDGRTVKKEQFFPILSGWSNHGPCILIQFANHVTEDKFSCY